MHGVKSVHGMEQLKTWSTIKSCNIWLYPAKYWEIISKLIYILPKSGNVDSVISQMICKYNIILLSDYLSVPEGTAVLYLTGQHYGNTVPEEEDNNMCST